MNGKEDWRQTVNSQHRNWATIAGFAISGLVIFISLGKVNLYAQKILFTSALISLIFQVILMIYVAEIERKTAFESNDFLSNFENILRPVLNLISILSWVLISILLIVSVWI